MTPWTRNLRTQRGLNPGRRLEILDQYIAATPNIRARLRKRYRIQAQSLQQWAMAYYGQGLRELRRQLGMTAQ